MKEWAEIRNYSTKIELTVTDCWKEEFESYKTDVSLIKKEDSRHNLITGQILVS